MTNRRYEDAGETSRSSLEDALEHRDTDSVCRALVALALHEPELDWIQGRCLQLTHHEEASVRAVAATCLGHLARIHGRVDMPNVLKELRRLQREPFTSGYAETALDDVLQYAGDGGASDESPG